MSCSETVYEKLLRQCEVAFAAKTPILYIRTSEMEVIDWLTGCGKLVTLLMKSGNRKTGVYRDVPYQPGDPIGAVANLHRQLPQPSLDMESPWKWQDGKSTTYPAPQLMIARAPKHTENSYDGLARYEGLTRYVEEYLRDTNDSSALRCSVMILYGETNELPQHLVQYAEFIDLELPDRGEIYDLIQQKMAEFGVAPFEDERDQLNLAASLLGFSRAQVSRLLGRLLLADEVDGVMPIYHDGVTQQTIRSAKEQMLKRGNVLELIRPQADETEIGGMSRLIDWLDEQREYLLNAETFRRSYGGRSPKGVLVCGIPGCGKSLAAEMLGKKLGIPLIRLDVGRLMDKYIGESEHNMLNALKLVETMSPCILWIDELDKGFSGAASGDQGDSGSFKRMFGSLLTWMQQNEKPCFIYATANNLSGMPKEFFRSGRFDALFSMYMPTFRECVEILRKRMEKAAGVVRVEEKRELFSEACYRDSALEMIVDSFCASPDGKKSARFVTGADLQKIVNTALGDLFRAETAKGLQPEPIGPEKWASAISTALKKSTVYGDGPENIDSIAVTYIRLLRKSFASSSAEVLFATDDYKVICDESGNVMNVSIQKREGSSFSCEYDRQMYVALYARMTQLAPDIEKLERRRLMM